jgi:hypothetical protein
MSDEITKWLTGYPTHVARLSMAACRAVLRAVPSAEERLRPGWKLIGYSAPRYFAFVAPKADHVEIGFEWGIMLPNLDELLVGSGSQVRVVVVRDRTVLSSPALAELLRVAAKLAPPPRARSSRS